MIVGIHNDVSPIQRTVELTPGCIGAPAYPQEMPKEMIAKLKPEGEVFEDFLLNTVKPAVEERFPVKKGRSNTAFCGSSMGGLFAFYIAMSHPDVFGFSGVLSPAFVVFDPDDVAAWIKAHASGELPFIYLYSGAADELEKTICEVTESSYDVLKDLFPKSLLKKVIMPEQPHHEKAWEPIFRDFLHIFLS